LCKPTVSSAIWLVSDDPTGEEAGCGGPGLAWLYMVCSCEARWCINKFYKITLEAAYGREINIYSLATALVDIPSVSNCKHIQN
jgi:hypothetical protein